MTITTDGIVAFCAGFLTVSAVIGLLVKFVLLPYLRTHLVEPVAEVREQVKNTHDSNLREDLDHANRALTVLTETVNDLTETVHDVRAEQSQVRRELDDARREDRQWRREHMAYSESISSRLETLESGRPDDN